MEAFDINRVHWEKGKFKPWYIDNKPVKISDLSLKPGEEMIIIELSGKVVGFLQREVIYHHIIQGQINNIDFILTFCGVCNAGVLLSPVIDNKIYHFREIGVYNGQQIFEDIQTKTLWNHLTGEALFGKFYGTTLPFIGSLVMTTFGEALNNYPDLPLYISGQKKIFRSLMRFVIRNIFSKRNKNWLPPHFEKTLPEIDNSLPKMTMGLAVKMKKSIKFYPVENLRNGEISDSIDGIKIHIFMDNKIPKAKTDTEEIPFQLFIRWYAFILTYPNGIIYEKN